MPQPHNKLPLGICNANYTVSRQINPSVAKRAGDWLFKEQGNCHDKGLNMCKTQPLEPLI